jgi:hypothetical protein
MARRAVVAIASSALLIVLWGCGGAASPNPSVAAASGPAPSTVESVAPPSVAASSTEPSTAPASGLLPSFSLPSEAKDLEALLPDTMCGGKSTKASVSGAGIGSSAGAEFVAGLAALGKSPADVSFAFAFSEAGCGAGIFRVAGVDQNALQTAMLAAVQKEGQTFTQSSVGGKSVFVGTDTSGVGKQYVYFHGDAMIFATATDDAKAAQILQSLP